MPADDLVLNVRQIAGYNRASAEATRRPIQRGGLAARICRRRGGFVARRSRGLRPVHGRAGGAIRRRRTADIHRRHFDVDGRFYLLEHHRTQTTDDAPFFRGSSAAFGVDPVAGFELHWAATAVEWGPAILTVSPTGLLAAQQIGLARDPAGPMEAATAQWVAATTVASFNGRGGRVTLWIDDIICAGGAPIYSPVFQGSPRAITPPPWSNSSRLATTAFVNCAIAGAYAADAPIDSPNFTGVPTAPTHREGSSDWQLATPPS